MNNAPREREKERDIWLSIVVIGRNESANLPALLASLPKAEDIELIYVDSNSVDHSVEVALDHGAAVYLIEEKSVFGPGTGRYIGTREAKGMWLLYLDGDMTMRTEFKDFLDRLREAEYNCGQAMPPQTAAFVGRTINIFYDSEGRACGKRDYVVLARQEVGDLSGWGKAVRYHGGAVLYRREYVLQSGNWNPAVYQLEELDLLSRVRTLGGVIRAVDIPMVEHHTPALSLVERIKLNFLAEYKGKKLYGLGQVVSASLREGGILSLMVNYPQPFIVFIGLLAAVPLGFIWLPLPLIINLAIALWFGLTKKWYFYLVYLGNLLQMFRGLGRYRRFEPHYRILKKLK